MPQRLALPGQLPARVKVAAAPAAFVGDCRRARLRASLARGGAEALLEFVFVILVVLAAALRLLTYLRRRRHAQRAGNDAAPPAS